MSKEIVFINNTDALDLEMPEPALSLVPEWYKNTESYTNNIKKPSMDGTTPASIKKCLPVFDAMTAGYIIKSPADVYVSKIDNQQHFQWASFNLIEFHPVTQAPLHPYRTVYDVYPKWINPWTIKTPKGYSVLFIQPLHRESVFTILPGIVDTDKYPNPVNFPFVIKDPNFEGLIPAGTPIAQVIPIKKESWNRKRLNKHDIIGIEGAILKLRSKFFDGYKNMYWTRKEYK